MSKKTRKAARARKQMSTNQRRKQEYEGLAGKKKEGRSAKRSRLQKKRERSVLRGPHTHCGNIACRKCYREFNRRLDAREIATGI
tara:strand:+ start:7604 stop:7858 length:255 start_codon:yes stop_codon:yes gene_type:complete